MTETEVDKEEISEQHNAPATATAVSAGMYDLETKILARLDAQHEAQLAAIHAGHSKLLVSFAEFGSSIRTLRERTHDTNNKVQKHEKRLDEGDKHHELHSKRLGKLEAVQAEHQRILNELKAQIVEDEEANDSAQPVKADS